LIQTTAAASLASLLPRAVFSQGAGNRKAIIHADQEIGLIRPELHSHFAEHLGSCVYGGLWVGKNSPVPNINGIRRAAVDHLKELGVPVLRWPGGCFADDYHWRDGIGPAAKRPKSVNTNWGGYTEDNSFGTHEFIEFCRLIGAEPYFAANVGSGSPHEMRDWMEYCKQPSGSSLAEERAANGSPDPFKVRYRGVGNELWGCGGNFTAQRAPEEYRHSQRLSGPSEAWGHTWWAADRTATTPNGPAVSWTHSPDTAWMGTPCTSIRTATFRRLNTRLRRCTRVSIPSRASSRLSSSSATCSMATIRIAASDCFSMSGVFGTA
jgi:hypothetical protein